MREMYAAGGAQLRRMFQRVHSAGPATSLDLCALDPESEAGHVPWERVLSRALPFVDIFAPSIGELLFILDRPAHAQLEAGAELSAVVDRQRLAELGDVVLGMGAAVAAIKLGDQGLYLRTARDTARISAFCDRIGLAADAWLGREVLAPCFAARSVAGTTGSGDCTIGGLLAALLRGRIRRARRRARPPSEHVASRVWIRQRNPAVAGRRRTDRTRLAATARRHRSRARRDRGA